MTTTPTGAGPAPLRILLADDNRVVRTALHALLRPLGHRVEVACDGREVLEAVGREPFDVVLLDLEMPVMGGLEAADRLRRDLPASRRPRVIAITGDAPAALDGGRPAGIDGVLAKPVRRRDVARALEGCPRVEARAGGGIPT